MWLFCLKSVLVASHIPHRAIASKPLSIHPRQNRDLLVDIIVDLNDSLSSMGAVQPPGILLECSPPRDRQGKKQGIQPRIVKAFSYVPSSSKKESLLVIRYRCKALRDFLPLPPTHAATKHDDVFREVP